ncbi:MAG: DinB family protein [Kineosporiaceae bacterium]
MERIDPPAAAGEKDTLLAFLQFHRDTLLGKVDGLSAERLRTRSTVSSLTLAGLLKHLALVEESWLVERFLGLDIPQPWAEVDFDTDPEWEFRTALGDDPEWLIARYRRAWERVDGIVADADLAALSAEEVRIDDRRERVSLRWILVHLIEETARHNGHADLLREAIDGATGE